MSNSIFLESEIEIKMYKSNVLNFIGKINLLLTWWIYKKKYLNPFQFKTDFLNKGSIISTNGMEIRATGYHILPVGSS